MKERGKHQIYKEKHMKHTLFALALLTTPGFAADIYREAPAQPVFEPEYTFSGPYIGIGAGYGMLNNDINIGPLEFDGIGADGIYGEAFIGWQREFSGGWLLGLEAGVTVDDTTTTIALAGLGSIEADRDWTAYAGVKAGRTVTEQALLYVMPFYRWTEMNVDISGGGGGVSFSESYDGPGVQVGLDVLATENIVLGIYGRGTFYQGQGWSVPGLDVETRELEAGARVAFKSNPLFGN